MNGSFHGFCVVTSRQSIPRRTPATSLVLSSLTAGKLLSSVAERESGLTSIRAERPQGIPKGRNGMKARKPYPRVSRRDNESEYDSDEETANGPGTASAHGDANADAIEADKEDAASYSKSIRATGPPVAAVSRKASAPLKKTSLTARKASAAKKTKKTAKGRKTLPVTRSGTAHRMSTRSRNKPATKRAPVESDESDDSEDYEDVNDDDRDAEAEDVDMLDAAAGASNDSVAPVANMTGGFTGVVPTLQHNAAPPAYVLYHSV